LNASLNATQKLQLQNEWVLFDARFAGVVHPIRVPMSAVLGIYARETGEGMVFNDNEPDAPTPVTDGAGATAVAPAPTAAARRAKLTVVK
jgi:stringent starvation protein B